MFNSIKKYIKDNSRVIGAFLGFAAYTMGLLYVAWVLAAHNDEKLALNILAILAGGTMGWLLGVLVSPYDNKEQQEFSKYATAVTAVASSYGVGKMDGFFSKMTDPANLDANTIFRIVGFLMSIIVVMLWTHAVRRYAPNEKP